MTADKKEGERRVDRRRVVIRPMTSAVSALSSLVAKWSSGHAHVSFCPSEIPYGGFSPVRLQTGLGPSSSPPGAHPDAYRWPKSRSSAATIAPTGQAPHRVGVGLRFRETVRSRGPWLTSGLFCPAGSMLTMASSEAPRLSRRLIFFAAGSLPCGQGMEIPCFTLLVLLSVPSAVPRRIRR
jgi:hypothetical protein